MRKTLSIFLALLCLLVSGCSLLPDTSDGGGNGDITTTATTSTTTTTTASSGYITEERALELAESFLGIRSGDRDSDTGFLFSWMVFDRPTEEKPEYRIALRWLVNDSHYSTVDVVLVNALTGEVYYPS